MSEKIEIANIFCKYVIVTASNQLTDLNLCF